MRWSATLTAAVEEGPVTVFVAMDYCTTECAGLHAARKVTRLWHQPDRVKGLRSTNCAVGRE